MTFGNSAAVDGITTCKCTHLREVEGSRRCVDYQEIKLQDHMERLALGRVPRTIVVLVKVFQTDYVF